MAEKVLTATLLMFLILSCLAQQKVVVRIFRPSAIDGFYCVNLGVILAMAESQAREIGASFPRILAFLLAAIVFLRPVPAHPWGEVIWVAVQPLCIAILLIYTISHQRKWASSILVSPIILWVGMVSNSAYLWQELFTGPRELYGSSWIAACSILPCLPCLH